MKSDYQHDREWSDTYIREIKRLVGPVLLDVTPNEIDCKQAADLMVFTARDMRIAARVRRPGFLEPYRYEFTVRSMRDSGAETELSKLCKGFGDWMFYGHASSAPGKIFDLCWLIDLHVFRDVLASGVPLCWGTKPNGDGTYFHWFDLRSFPRDLPILVAGIDRLPKLPPGKALSVPQVPPTQPMDFEEWCRRILVPATPKRPTFEQTTLVPRP